VWTKDKIQNLLATSDKAVERACIAIYDRQTQDEKRSSITNHDNTIGFTGAHASKGSYYARWCLSGRHLNGIHLVKARSMMMHYHRQLCEIANAKQAGATRISSVGGIPLYGKPGVLKGPVEEPMPGVNYNEEGADIPRQPPVGSWAAIARDMVSLGVMDGDAADEWKDRMKDLEMEREGV